jgi:hypothetical protein
MTAVLAPSPRHPWELLLEQLTGRSGLRHVYGTENEAKAAPVDVVTWVPGKLSFRPRSFNVRGSDTTKLLCVAHRVTVYGALPVAAIQRVADLAGQMDLLAGPEDGTPFSEDTGGPQNGARPGYALTAGDEPVRSNEPGGAWALVLGIELRVFVSRLFYGSAVVRTVDVTTSATDTTGSDVLVAGVVS